MLESVTSLAHITLTCYILKKSATENISEKESCLKDEKLFMKISKHILKERNYVQFCKKIIFFSK